MSATTAVLIAIFSGLVGVLARISYERGAELRTRQLNAADEFLATASPALNDIDQAAVTALTRYQGVEVTSLGAAKAPEVALAELPAAAGRLELQLARIHLLFGAESETGSNGGDVVKAIKAANGKLHYFAALPVPGSEARPKEFAEFTTAMHNSFLQTQQDARSAYDRFAAAARRAVVPWWRWWERPALPAPPPPYEPPDQSSNDV